MWSEAHLFRRGFMTFLFLSLVYGLFLLLMSIFNTNLAPLSDAYALSSAGDAICSAVALVSKSGNRGLKSSASSWLHSLDEHPSLALHSSNRNPPGYKQECLRLLQNPLRPTFDHWGRPSLARLSLFPGPFPEIEAEVLVLELFLFPPY